MNVADVIQAGGAITILGTDLRYDHADPLQGIFLTAGANTQRQGLPVLNEPSRIIVMATLPTLAAQNDVEMSLKVSTKYTSTGEIRTSEYAKWLRAVNEVDDGHANIFYIDGGSNAEITNTSLGPDLKIKLRARIRTDNVLVITACPLEADYSLYQEYEVRASGVVTIAQGGETNSILVDIMDYELLYSQIELRGKYVEEVCNCNIEGT